MKSIRFSVKHAAGVGVVIIIGAATMASAMTTGPIALFADASAPALGALIKEGGNRAVEAMKQRFGALASSGSYGSTRPFESVVSREALANAASNNLQVSGTIDPETVISETPTGEPGGVGEGQLDENGIPIPGSGGMAVGGGAGGGGGLGGSGGGGGRGLGLLAAGGLLGGIAAATASDNNNSGNPPTASIF